MLTFIDEESIFFDYDAHPQRAQILAWLMQQSIEGTFCGYLASARSMQSYSGEVSIDVPFDEQDPRYRQVERYVEYPDGTMRFDHTKFHVATLEVAMRNEHHDEAGFWERRGAY
jgi:hypothetical protein